MPESSDPLDSLRDQIRAATEAAERLVRETTGGRRPPPPPPAPPPAGGRIPASGWAIPSPEQETAAEIQALAHLVGALRDLLPAEIQEQLGEVMRQLLILLRAVIDFALSRMEHNEAGRDVQVEDIPIS